MKLEDRYYSESELRGKNSENPEEDKLYSQQEVLEISDLFDEFYSEHGDTYSDVDEAYDEFIEAYSNVGDEYADPEMINENPKQEAPKKRTNISIKDPRVTKAIVGTAGAGAGLALSKILTRKDIAEKKSIEEKMSKGLASVKDIERLEKIKRKIRAKVAASTVGGAALGVGGVHLYGKYKNKNFSANIENAFVGASAGSVTASFAHLVRIYATKEGKEFVSLHKKKEDLETLTKAEKLRYVELRKKLNKKFGRDQVIGLVSGAFLGYIANGLKGAYQASNGYRKSRKDSGDKTDMGEMWGRAKWGFDLGHHIGSYSDNSGDEYSLEDLREQQEKSKNKNYSDDSYAQFIISKKKLKDSIAKNRYSNHKNAAIGALAGTATGLLAAKLTDKGSARRKELKAKISSGNASPQETKEYAEAKKKARKRMAIAGGAGLATGAAAGYNTNRVKGAYKSLKEVDRSEFKLKKFKNKKHRSNFMELAKGAAFNGHLHGGKSTNELMDTVKK